MKSTWRIATEGKTYSATDLSGEGASRTGGRWNSMGLRMVYSAGSASLACLETLVHIQNDLPLNRYLIRIDIPDSIWNKRKKLNGLPGWDAEPAGLASINFGDIWLTECESALLEVPSVIVPEESNFLINPLHKDAKKIKAINVRKWIYSKRLK